jgi:tetratricopeptide (TPR) repeat protein
MITFLTRKRSSSLALAIALATGGAVVTTAVFPTEASAQRRDRDRDKDKDENDGGGYSDEFRAIYVPLDELLKTEGADISGIKPQLLSLAAVLTTNDEKYAGGNMIFNGGIKLQDRPLQLQGMQTMLSSGMVPAENVGRFNFIAYQISNQLGDQPTARTHLQAAIDNNFTTDTISASSLRVAMMESFFSGGEYDAGFAYLRDAISTQKAQGLSVDESWYRRGITVSYENEITPTVYEIAVMWLSDYPSETNWRDAVNIARNLNDFQPAEMLDLFRLSRSAGALSEASDYDYYVEVADARRLPSEVKAVIEEGKAAGVITDSNLFIAEALGIANTRIDADRADLPALERDASAPDAGLRTVVAAGDAFLSYGEYAKAAMFYERSLTMPEVKVDEELTRLGIAQIGAGDFVAARENLGRVSGTRKPIAMLWAAYANQLEGASGTSPAVAPSNAPATAGVTE